MNNANHEVYIVDGARTPFIKVQGKPNKLSASDLAVEALNSLLLRQPFAKEEIEEVIAGCVAPSPDEVNIGRIIGLRVGCGDHVPGFTVQRNCGSALQAIDSGALMIATGQREVVIAGGTEAMSRAPVFFQENMVDWLANFRLAKGKWALWKEILKFKPRYLSPIFGLMKGLTDPIVNLTMGQTAENLAYLFNISREAMDEYALSSHLRAKAGIEKGLFDEIVPVFDKTGQAFLTDNGIRDTSLQKLAALKPVFDKPFGVITAGNSSQVTDGAAFVILASQAFVKKHDLPVLGRIVRTTWSALSPAVMGLGPVHAIAQLLSLEKLKVSDIEYWEINEAFAAQVLACLKAMESQDYARKYLHQENAVGSIDPNRLNVDGGAIAIGHPVGASGARLVLHLMHVLERQGAKRGIASLCIGGGQGGAILLERL